MISGMRFALVSNVASTNGVLSFGVSPSLRIAAAVWITTRIGTLANTRIECLRFALGQVLKHYPNCELWLVAGHRVAQPDNRLTRHFGLWKSLEKRGVAVPTGDFLKEALVSGEDGIRFFSAVRFSPEQVEEVASILASESATIVVFGASHGRNRNRLEELVLRGWASTNTKPPEEVLELICSEGGLVLDIFGEFDDVEIAAAVMGKEELIADLNNY